MEKIKGTKPTILILDDVSDSLVLADFAKLEEMVMAQNVGYLPTKFSDEASLIDIDALGTGTGHQFELCTGRIRYTQPALQELPNVRQLQAEALGKVLEQHFRLYEKDIGFFDRYHNSDPILMKKAFRIKDLGADHPTRKREPKGPRGRWGKL